MTNVLNLAGEWKVSTLTGGRKRGMLVPTPKPKEQMHMANIALVPTEQVAATSEDGFYVFMTQRTCPHAHHITTYADSAASDHCFVSVSDFSTYVPLNEKKGTTATAGGTFKIHGMGTVRKWVNFNGKIINLTLTDTLHTPELSHNLISIGRLDKAGCYTVFGGSEVIFIDKQNNPFMREKGVGTMYEVEAHSLDNPMVPAQTPISVNCAIAAKNTVAIYATRSHTRPTDINTWH